MHNIRIMPHEQRGIEDMRLEAQDPALPQLPKDERGGEMRTA
jgi:hypothetical protein